MPPLRPLAFLLSASLMAGCAVGPDYHRPSAPLSSRYVGQPSVEQRSASAQADLVRWWEAFGDPTLTAFITKALEQNLDLAQASARVTQARAGLGAANAALLPSGNINGQAARAYQSVETPLGQVLDSTPGYDRYGNLYELNLGASWEIDAFGGLRRGREAAMAEYQASEAGVVATRLASPLKSRISTLPPAACRRGWISQSARSSRSRTCWKKSGCSTAKAWPPITKSTRPRGNCHRCRPPCRCCRLAWTPR